MSQTKLIQASGASGMHATTIVGTIATALTATGSSQATALVLGTDVNEVTTAAASTGVMLPACSPGDSITIGNYGAQTLSVYGQLGESVSNGSVNAAFSVAANKSAIFIKASNTRWNAILSA